MAKGREAGEQVFENLLTGLNTGGEPKPSSERMRAVLPPPRVHISREVRGAQL